MGHADHPAILASDAERERTLELLQGAVVEGRLPLEEFSDRVDRVHRARTDRDLAAVTVDVPGPPAASIGADAAPVRFRATMSRLVRRGSWELPARSSWRSLFGTIELDLREARLPGPEVELAIYNLFGTVTIRVPPGVTVEVDGGGAFASQVIDPPPWPAPAGAPLLRIRVTGPGGTLYVRSAEPRTALSTRARAGFLPRPPGS
jgi:hypothetical protein